MYSTLVLILGLSSSPFLVLADEYNDYWCGIQKRYCDGKEHIGCKPNSFPYNLKVNDLKLVKVTPELKNLIVDTHNKYRNQVAIGDLKGYEPAAQMNLVQWDEDLAETAELMAEHGTYKHDQCRATETSGKAGQNIGYSRSTEKLNETKVVETRMRKWFEEYKLNPEVVKRYFRGSGAGHFTAMVRDKTSLIGCAASSFNYEFGGRLRYQIIVACNYQTTNILNAPTYTPGKSCSQCPSGCSITYKGLCVGGQTRK